MVLWGYWVEVEVTVLVAVDFEIFLQPPCLGTPESKVGSSDPSSFGGCFLSGYIF